jgi:Tfp pilus assembly protein PilV
VRPLDNRKVASTGRLLKSQDGVGFIEVLVASVVAGIAALGIAVMVAKGSGWVAAGGDNRVAMRLAQQKIEHLRSIPFNCIPVGGPPSSGTGVLGATGPAAAGCTTITQKYCEGVTSGANPCVKGAGVGDWVSASSATIAAPQPPPVPTAGVSNQVYLRKTCVQYVAASPNYDFNTPAFTGAVNSTAPTFDNCAAGAATNVKRIVVVVQPTTPSGGALQESDAPVVLQAWITSVPGGL